MAAAGIAWLIAKYKQYLILRERVLSDTNVLRSKLDSAAPDFEPGHSDSESRGEYSLCARCLIIIFDHLDTETDGQTICIEL